MKVQIKEGDIEEKEIKAEEILIARTERKHKQILEMVIQMKNKVEKIIEEGAEVVDTEDDRIKIHKLVEKEQIKISQNRTDKINLDLTNFHLVDQTVMDQNPAVQNVTTVNQMVQDEMAQGKIVQGEEVQGEMDQIKMDRWPTARMETRKVKIRNQEIQRNLQTIVRRKILIQFKFLYKSV